MRRRLHKKSTVQLMALGLSLLLLAGCNLGQQAPPEDLAPLDLGGDSTNGDGTLPGGEGDLNAGGDPNAVDPAQVPSPTPLIELPPTATIPPALAPSEELGPITVDGIAHRTQEPVTVRVERGKSVSNVDCRWVLQDTGQEGVLGTPVETDIDIDTQQLTYTFTPEAAGTYQVSCTGIALTAAGNRPVSFSGTPFAVEAKG